MERTEEERGKGGGGVKERKRISEIESERQTHRYTDIGGECVDQ